MPETPSKLQWVQVTAKLSPRDVALLKTRAENARSIAEVIRQVVSDSHDWFGLPELLAKALEADAESKGKDQRAYVIDLLSERYQTLIREQALHGSQGSGHKAKGRS